LPRISRGAPCTCRSAAEPTHKHFSEASDQRAREKDVCDTHHTKSEHRLHLNAPFFTRAAHSTRKRKPPFPSNGTAEKAQEQPRCEDPTRADTRRRGPFHRDCARSVTIHCGARHPPAAAPALLTRMGRTRQINKRNFLCHFLPASCSLRLRRPLSRQKSVHRICVVAPTSAALPLPRGARPAPFPCLLHARQCQAQL
jgi:hypothetical protein